MENQIIRVEGQYVQHRFFRLPFHVYGTLLGHSVNRIDLPMVRVKRFHEINSFTNVWFVRFLAERKLDGSFNFIPTLCRSRTAEQNDRVITLEQSRAIEDRDRDYHMV